MMRKWMTAALCAVLSALLCLPVLGGQKDDIAPCYTPATQEDTVCVPLNLEQQIWHEGEIIETHWNTLYNPETASMMIDMAKASSKIGKNSDWEKTMTAYGYEQLYYTEDNIPYSTGEPYHMGFWYVDDEQVEVTFPAINAIIGIQPVEYNGMTRYAVAITFRGTHDWADVGADILQGTHTENGFHKGFYQNAKDFYYDLSPDVTFTVEGETYTLWDIYDEMRIPNSKFCMLVMGHSLGGSLTDVLVGRFLYDHDVHPSNIAGYTIGAAPSAPFTYKYPYSNIYNIISVDDLVPSATIFANQHIGQVISYAPDDDFRREHYDVEGEFYPAMGNDWWQTVGFLTTLAKPHLIHSAYAPIVERINAEVDASTAENPSRYTSYSTCGYNNWGFGDAVISPCTFGDFSDSIHTGDALRFEGGVLQVAGNLEVLHGLHMHDKNDYLLVNGDLDIGWGVHVNDPLHLTAGTVELKGDFSTGNFNSFEYSYRETGTHRTVLSGTGTQTLLFNDEDVRLENLYIRNPNICFQNYVPYFQLEEDAVISDTGTLTAWEMDLNGHSLTLDGNLFTYDLTMGGGTLEVSGNAEIEGITALNGTMTVGGNLDMAETLVFDGGSLHVTGDCYLPASMTMRKAEDYLRVDGTLTLFAREDDPLPDDHLSAGTVELKGDLQFDDMGVCQHNAYHETAGHKTILSGDSRQTLWFHNAASANRLENLCIRNPQTALYMVKNVRLGEDAAITVTGDNREQRVVVNGTLDLNGHSLTIDASGWTNTTVPAVELTAISSSKGGRLSVDGDVTLTGGTLSGEVSVTGDLTVHSLLTFAEAQLSVGGNCDLPYSFVMQSDADYLLVGGDLTLWSNSALPSDHLSAGTVELKGDLSANGGDNYYSYHATNTHRTIFSGKGVQRVRMGAMYDHKVLQACLRNPDVVMESVFTLRLMESAVISDLSGWHLYGKLDLNGQKLTALGAFDPKKVPITDAQAPEGASVGVLQMTVETDTEEVPAAVTITVPEAMVAEEDLHILFTGYDDLHRMVVCQAMHFTSESQMTQTLSRENWPECKTTRIYWLEGDFAPFCTATSLGW